MFRFSLLLAAFCLTVNSYAASVQGIVKGPDGKPLEFAVVTLLSASDSSLVKGDVTDEKGDFSLEEIPADTYLLTISFTGMNKLWNGPFTLAQGESKMLGELPMSTSKEMKEVTISSVRPLFEQKPGKLVMNVESSPIRIAGTAWDLLGKCPGVYIDQNSNISLRGKNGVQVYIDDRPTYLSGDGLKSYLQGIPASDIVTVEIINNPSAKYDAAGTAGILNLVTQKGSRQGLNASARLGYGLGIRPKYYSGFNFNYAKEKFNVYGSVTVNQRYDVERIALDRSIPFAGDTTSFNQKNTMYNYSPVYISRGGIDYKPKKGITLGLRVQGYYSPQNTVGNNITQIHSSSSNSSSTLSQVNYMDQHSLNGGGGVNYRQEFDSLGREISASFDYMQFANENVEKYNLHFYDEAGTENSTPAFQRTFSNTGISIYAGKVDYIHPFTDKINIETGVKCSYVETDNDLKFDELLNNSWQNDSGRSNHFNYKEQINAAYINFNASFSKIELMIGLRGEQTLSDGKSKTTGQEQKRSYAQLFPNISLTHKISEQHTITYSWSRRINRPNYEALNPFVYYLDQYTYQTGNPFLQPEISDNGDITYSYLDAAYLSVGFSATHHAMQDVTQQIDSSGITFQTTKNFNTVTGTYAGLGIPVPIGNWFMMENEFYYSNVRYQTNLFGTTVDAKANAFNLSTNITISLKKDFKIMLWGWYNSKTKYGIFEIKPVGGTGFGFSKGFFSNTLQLNLSLRDALRTNGMRTTINFQNQHVYFRTIPESPQLFFMIRYSFGNKRAAKKSEFEGGADDLKNRTEK